MKDMRDVKVNVLPISKETKRYYKAKREKLGEEITNELHFVLVNYFKNDTEEIDEIIGKEIKKFIKKKKLVAPPKFGHR